MKQRRSNFQVTLLFFSAFPFGSQRAREPVHMSIQCRVEIIGCNWKLSSLCAKLFAAFSVHLPAVLLVLVVSPLLVMGTLVFRYLIHEYCSFSVVLSLYLHFQNLLLPTPLPTPLMTVSLYRDFWLGYFPHFLSFLVLSSTLFTLTG